ncbi:MAE_28990/MAE_18760 family HEPN-like nuclease [Lysobacter xanthus]
MEALTGFTASLVEIRKIADHADVLLGDRTSGETELANEIARSALVLLCGYFEGFVRELTQEAVDRINDEEVDVNSLPKTLLVSLVETALKSTGDKRTEALSVLRDRIKSGEPCALDRKGLSTTGGNPTVDVIEGLLGTFGIASIIDSLSIRDYELDSTYTVEPQSKAIEAAIANALGDEARDSVSRVLEIVDAKWLPKKRRRSVGYVSAIEELLKRRNRIAHGEGREIVTPSELREHAAVIGKLAAGMSEAMDALIDDLVPAPSEGLGA